MIVVENLTKQFAGRDLFSTVSFTVSSGEKLAWLDLMVLEKQHC